MSNEELFEALKSLFEIISYCDGDICMCGDSEEDHGHDHSFTPMLDYHFNIWCKDHPDLLKKLGAK